MEPELYSLETLRELRLGAIALGFMDDAKHWEQEIARLEAK